MTLRAVFVATHVLYATDDVRVLMFLPKCRIVPCCSTRTQDIENELRTANKQRALLWKNLRVPEKKSRDRPLNSALSIATQQVEEVSL
jgi:hypothetical protein